MAFAAAQPARADEPAPAASEIPLELKNQCADAYEATQRERAAGQLIAARSSGIFCAQASCPEVLRGDCAKWAGEAANGIPSLVIEAHSKRGDLLTDVSVEVDGTPFVDHLDGRSRELDPGRHRFRVQAPGFVPNESELVVVEGHETQRLSIALDPIVELRRAPAAQHIPASAYALGGAGVLGLASFSVFALVGNHEKGKLSLCEPACDPAKRAPIRRDYLIADLSLGASLVSFGISAWIALASQRSGADEPAVDVRANSDGAWLAYRRKF